MALEGFHISQPGHRSQPFDEGMLGKGSELVFMPIGEQMDIVGYLVDTLIRRELR